MPLFKVVACLSIYVALSIVPFTNATGGYTHITTSMVNSVFTAAGFRPNDYVTKWFAEGNAISRALNYVGFKFGGMFSDAVIKEDIEVIVASTGGNTSAYIYGLAERLRDPKLRNQDKPSKIIVVYTLNYASDFAVEEYSNFRKALGALIVSGGLHNPKIEVEVFQFRPVANKYSELIKAFDFQNKEIEMADGDQDVQHDTIDRLHNAIEVAKAEIIDSQKFAEKLTDNKIKTIVDGIVDSGAKQVTAKNQLLTAISRAQIRIMGTGILGLGIGVIVICNDNPSGMDENGNWAIDAAFRYPVRYIFSSVWNKLLVNSRLLAGGPIVIVLDIKYNDRRLFEVLLDIIKAAGNHDPKLVEDVEKAKGITDRAIAFREIDGRMHVV